MCYVTVCKIVNKLRDLGLNAVLCGCFLTSWQTLRVWAGNHTSSSLILNTEMRQGCCISLSVYDCGSAHDPRVIVKFAGDVAVDGLVSNNNDQAYTC